MDSAQEIIGSRHDVEVRDQKVFHFFLLGCSRKQIVRHSSEWIGQQLQYDAVKKIIQKMRRIIPKL